MKPEMFRELERVRNELPETVKIIARLVGMPRTIKLIEQLGGTTFPVSKNLTRQGNIRFEILAESVGVPAAELLTSHFGGDTLYIPSCADALRLLRNMDIVTRFDQLSVEIGANNAVFTLAREFHLSDRRVWEILKTTTLEVVNPQPDFGF